MDFHREIIGRNVPNRYLNVTHCTLGHSIPPALYVDRKVATFPGEKMEIILLFGDQMRFPPPWYIIFLLGTRRTEAAGKEIEMKSRDSGKPGHCRELMHSTPLLCHLPSMFLLLRSLTYRLCISSCLIYLLQWITVHLLFGLGGNPSALAPHTYTSYQS